MFHDRLNAEGKAILAEIERGNLRPLQGKKPDLELVRLRLFYKSAQIVLPLLNPPHPKFPPKCYFQMNKMCPFLSGFGFPE